MKKLELTYSILFNILFGVLVTMPISIVLVKNFPTTASSSAPAYITAFITHEWIQFLVVSAAVLIPGFIMTMIGVILKQFVSALTLAVIIAFMMVLVFGILDPNINTLSACCVFMWTYGIRAGLILFKKEKEDILPEVLDYPIAESH